MFAAFLASGVDHLLATEGSGRARGGDTDDAGDGDDNGHNGRGDSLDTGGRAASGAGAVQVRVACRGRTPVPYHLSTTDRHRTRPCMTPLPPLSALSIPPSFCSLSLALSPQGLPVGTLEKMRDLLVSVDKVYVDPVGQRCAPASPPSLPSPPRSLCPPLV